MGAGAGADVGAGAGAEVGAAVGAGEGVLEPPELGAGVLEEVGLFAGFFFFFFAGADFSGGSAAAPAMLTETVAEVSFTGVVPSAAFALPPPPPEPPVALPMPKAIRNANSTAPSVIPI